MMSDRSSSREGEPMPENRMVPDFSKFNVCSSYSQSSSLISSGGEERRRLSRQQLEELNSRLSGRDREVITAIQRFRYLLTGQVERLFFTDAATKTAGLRAANRCLKRLWELGLINHLARRIGGVRAGSGGMVWYITHAGERLLRLNEQPPRPMKRFFEPSAYFLAHCLAAADIAITLTEICREQDGSTLTVLQTEPECWRTYSEYGSMLSLKPDLFAVTESGRYEDRFFLEIDLDTESTAKGVEKCEKYHRYYRCGLEQQETGVFPLTVWIVPGAGRKQRLLEHIRKAFDRQPKLFAVITKDELRMLIRQGGNGEMLC